MMLYNKGLLLRLMFILIFTSFSTIAMAIYGDTRPYELKYSDKQLNVLYNKMLDQMSLSDQKKLRKAQRQWIIFRDHDCSFSPLLDCLIDRTDERVKELEGTSFFDKQHRWISGKKNKVGLIQTPNKNLSEIYQKQLHRLSEEEKKQFNKAENQWIVFKDLDCLWAFSGEHEYCLVDRTQNRVDSLSESYFY